MDGAGCNRPDGCVEFSWWLVEIVALYVYKIVRPDTRGSGGSGSVRVVGFRERHCSS